MILMMLIKNWKTIVLGGGALAMGAYIMFLHHEIAIRQDAIDKLRVANITLNASITMSNEALLAAKKDKENLVIATRAAEKQSQELIAHAQKAATFAVTHPYKGSCEKTKEEFVTDLNKLRKAGILK